MAETEKVAVPPARWLRLALVVSLTVNLLILGLAVGAALNWRKYGPPQNFDMSVGPIGRALLPDDRRAVGEALRDRRDARLPSRDERNAEARALADALRDTPFDADGFAALLDAQQSRGRAVQAAALAALVARISMLSPEERAAFADRIEANLHDRDDVSRRD